MHCAPHLTEADVLAALSHRDQPVTADALARAMGRNPYTVRSVLTRLARAGLAEQVPVPGRDGSVTRLEYRRAA
ncbi:DNA-binding IclR family transcriptional regulator [Deinococcus sp. HSC-46F16]|uniref:MarR family transcriptional regulator n=1 Tax=Deinococcus sp. HSC-46F16 TaxID=2910968 RepID=UPI0020A1BA61|nr:MarR family transcriptional regulator [Deinococcus sp. HSC-46F16]MCP2015646.1 DNA-binding IclR family transcriptional regulator [Deinococcus sp. HSC-46F16]